MSTIYSLITRSGVSLSLAAFQNFGLTWVYGASEIDANHFLVISADASGYLTAYIITELAGLLSVGTGTILTTAAFRDGSIHCDTNGLSAVVTWIEASGNTLMACFLSISGTTITVSKPEFSVFASPVNDSSVSLLENNKAIVIYEESLDFYLYATVIDSSGIGASTQIDTTNYKAIGGVIAPTNEYAIIFSGAIIEVAVSGYNITKLSSTSVVSSSPNYIQQLSASTAIIEYGAFSSTGYARLITFIVPSLQQKTLSISTPVIGGATVWRSYWDGTDLKVERIVAATGAVDVTETIGACTSAELESTYAAYVFAIADSVAIVYGYFNHPTLGAAQIITTVDGGANWTVMQSGWGSDICGALVALSNQYVYAIRNTGGAPVLYSGSIGGLIMFERATLPFSADITHGNLVIDGDANLFALAATAESIMVAIAPPPYLEWVDITSDHPAVDGKRIIRI